jgi:RNA ligase
MSYNPFDAPADFPFLENDESIRAALTYREEIRFATQPNGTSVCCYMISGPDTFIDNFAREARGVVFDANGKTIARPLHKFFNVNQMEHTLVANIDWSSVDRVMQKRDGSMIHTVVFPEDGRNFTVKSKKSYESDVAVQSKKWLLQHENYVKFCTDMADNDLTAVFEWTSPTARIVVEYTEDMLTLLHIRDNITGAYFNQYQLETLCEKYGIPLVESLLLMGSVSVLTQMEVYLETSKVDSGEGIEGWVIQFKNGDMVKLKTKWYMDRHHAMTFLRVRDIARMVVDETLDDLIAKLVGDGINVDQIRDIETQVVVEVRKIEHEINSFYESVKAMDRKTLAITHRDFKYFGMLMQKYSGREPNVKEYFSKNVLDGMFDLRQINLVDSIAEAE